MRAFSYSWSLPVTWQKWRSQHSFRHSRMVQGLQANFMAVCFIERKLLPMEVLHCDNRNFRPLWLLWPWTWPDALHDLSPTRVSACLSLRGWCGRQPGIHCLSSSRYSVRYLHRAFHRLLHGFRLAPRQESLVIRCIPCSQIASR